MSMENAILELAAAIRYHADALAQLALAGGGGLSVPNLALPTTPAANSKPNTGAAAIVTGDPEIEQAVEMVEAAAKEEKPAPTKAEVIAQAKADAAAAKEAKAEEPAEEAIDYKTGVYPKLVDLGKTKGRGVVVGLLAEFGAKNGDQLKPEQYAQVLARAAELAA